MANSDIDEMLSQYGESQRRSFDLPSPVEWGAMKPRSFVSPLTDRLKTADDYMRRQLDDAWGVAREAGADPGRVRRGYVLADMVLRAPIGLANSALKVGALPFDYFAGRGNEADWTNYADVGLMGAAARPARAIAETGIVSRHAPSPSRWDLPRGAGIAPGGYARAAKPATPADAFRIEPVSTVSGKVVDPWYTVYRGDKPVASVSGYIADNTLRGMNISPIREGLEGGVGSLGVAGLRAIREQFRRDFPNVKRFTGTRVSGARVHNNAPDYRQTVVMPEWLMPMGIGGAGAAGVLDSYYGNQGATLPPQHDVPQP